MPNALCHRDYTIPGGAVAVAMYDNRLEIRNPGDLHFGITPEKLTRPHESKPWNPIIANVFYRAGIIERWGAGTLNIIDWCEENGNPAPAWQQQAGSVYVTFLPAILPDTPEVTGEVTRQVTPQEAAVFAAARNPVTRSELQKSAGLRDREHFVNTRLNPLLEAGFLEMTIPDKPRSSKQKYRLTGKGQSIVKDEGGRRKDEQIPQRTQRNS